MSEVATPIPPANATESSSHDIRWRRRVTSQRKRRFQVAAASCSIVATLLAAIFAFSTLVEQAPSTVLVSLYLPPPADEAMGTQAPFHPLSNRLFDLAPANVVAIASPSKQEATKEPHDDPKPASIAFRLTDWKAAVERCKPNEELILHVSALSRIEHDQVFFFGRETDSPSEVAFKEILELVAESPAKKTLIVMEVNWPMISDHGASQSRLQQIDSMLRREFLSFAPKSCQLLLPAYKNEHLSLTSNGPRSNLCVALSNALETPQCDANRDGRISLAELTRWLSTASVAGQVDRMSLVAIDVLGDNIDFEFKAKPFHASDRPAYPALLAESWSLRQQYMNATDVPWLDKTARRWGLMLNDLESRWRRGEPIASIEGDATEVNRACLIEISSALDAWRRSHADSLLVAATRFPTDESDAANRQASELLNRFREEWDITPIGDRSKVVARQAAEYVAAEFAKDTPLALQSLLRAVENTNTIDQSTFDLIVQVRQKLPKLSQFPVVDAIDLLAKTPFDSRRVSQVLRLMQLQDQLGMKPDASALLSTPVTDSLLQIVDALRLLTESGMSDEASIDAAVARAVTSAEAVIYAEKTISQAMRRLEVAMLTVALDESIGLRHPSTALGQQILMIAERSVELLRQIQSKADSERAVSATDIAFLRQEVESLHRLFSQKVERIQADFRRDPQTFASNLSLTIEPHARIRMLCGDSFSPSITSASYQRPSSSLDRSPGERDAMLRKVCLTNFSGRLTALRHLADERRQSSWRSFISSGASLEAFPSYARIVRELKLDVSSSVSPVQVKGDLQGLSWDHPEATLELSLTKQDDANVPVYFQFLDPASANLQITPRSGVLNGDTPLRVAVSLCKSKEATVQTILRGLWLKVSCDRTESLIAVRMPPQPSLPRIDLQFGPSALVNGRAACIPLWPSTDAQPLAWFITSNDPLVNQAKVTIVSSEGRSISSEAIDLEPFASALISFPSPKPAAAVATTVDPNVAGAMTFPLSVVVSDAKDGKTLGKWQVTTELGDPRLRLRPGVAEFVVDEDGTNRLTVALETRTYEPTAKFPIAFEPSMRLELNAGQPDSLIDYGNSKLQTPVNLNHSPHLLHAENLRFAEGSNALFSIPLSINGDDGYFEVQGRFPRQAGIIKLEWDQQPQLRIDAAKATVPGVPLQVTIEARNLEDRHALVLELTSVLGGSEHRVWRKTLPTSRHLDSSFTSAGSGATLSVVATRRHWQLKIPTDFGTGDYQLRASTVASVGNHHPSSVHRFVIDDSEPSLTQVRAERELERTTIHIACRLGKSGIESLAIMPATGDSNTKGKPIVAHKSNNDDDHWQANWPATIPLPEQLELLFVTGAGKQVSLTSDVSLHRVEVQSQIAGRVMEGSLAQPNLSVVLRQSAGGEVAKYTTDANGRFLFTVAPGTYQLFVEKTATGRKAAAQITVSGNETGAVDLSLRR